MKNYYINKIGPWAHEIFSSIVFVFVAVSTTFTLAAGLKVVWNNIFPYIEKYREINIWEAAFILAAIFLWLRIERLLNQLRITKKQR